jgi:hypothetical protein
MYNEEQKDAEDTSTAIDILPVRHKANAEDGI